MKRIFFLLLIANSLLLTASYGQVITDTAALRAAINTDIVPNASGGITATKLNRILLGNINALSKVGITSIYFRDDSVFYVKAGTETLAFLYDSSGHQTFQNTLILSSDLTQDNDIEADGFDFRINDGGEIGFSGDSVTLSANAGANHMHLKGDSASFNKRISYESNLNGSFTLYSLVTKQYVDSLIATASGNVTKVGTPANNQIGVWTGDGTIEGSSALTFDAATGIVTTPKLVANSNTDGGGTNDAAVLIQRNINENNGSHGFRDKTFITGPLTGTASFDAEATVNTTNDTLDHMVGFQSRHIIDMGGSGLLNTAWAHLDNTQLLSKVTSLIGFESLPAIFAGGSVVNRSAIRVKEYAGSINLAANTYGILFADLLYKATGDNFGLYDNADNKHYLQNLILGSSPTASSVAAIVINSTTKGFLISRMTATQASAITAVNGLMLYVTDTNGTFTSVGFWGYENAAWIKL